MVSICIFLIGVLLIALSLVLGAPAYPALIVASLPTFFCIGQYLMSGTIYFKKGAAFRITVTNLFWAGSSGALVNPETAVLWGLGFGCWGFFFGRYIENLRTQEKHPNELF